MYAHNDDNDGAVYNESCLVMLSELRNKEQ